MFEHKLPITIGRGKVVAVADIGGGSAAVAYVRIERDTPACIIAAERSVISLEERDRKATIASIGSALLDAGGKAEKAYREHEKAAPAVLTLYCIIRAPWTRSKTSRAHKIFDHETAVTAQILQELSRQAVEAEKELNKQNLLEAAVVRVEVNGYPVGKPEGQLATSLGLTTLVSDCDQELKAAVAASLQQLFPHLTPLYRSSARAMLAALKEEVGGTDDCFIVEVLSEATSLIAVRDGAPAEQAMVPEGVHNMLKRIAPSGIPEETLNLIRMLSTELCSSAACEAIQSSMAKVEPDLVRVFGEGMSACASPHRLPNKLVLATQGELTQWLSKFFSRIDFSQFTQTTQPFTVHVLMPESLSSKVCSEGTVHTDTGLCVSIALVNREEGGS